MPSRQQPAQASLAVVVAMTIILLSVAMQVSIVSYTHYTNQRSALNANQAFLNVDSGLEESLLRLHRDATYSGGTITIAGADIDIDVQATSVSERTISSNSTFGNVQRNLSAEIEIAGLTNPIAEFAVFAGEDVNMVKSHSMLVGDLWSNDNLNLDDNTIVRGNVYTAGQGAGSQTRVQHSGRVEDNPDTPELEGNVTSIDRIVVNNSGYVQGTATSKTAVQITSGGSVGGSVVNPSLTVDTIQIPVFQFDDYKAQAQAAGTYYTTTTQFLNYLTANGNTMPGGVHYINSTSTLTFPASGTYNLTGTLISNGSITIQAASYTHTADSNLPVLASKRAISFTDQSSCNCVANVTGIIFANQDITFKHDGYTGGLTYAVEINGVAWSGDGVNLEDRSRLTFNSAMASAAEGFNFLGTGGTPPPSTDNIVEVSGWVID